MSDSTATKEEGCGRKRPSLALASLAALLLLVLSSQAQADGRPPHALVQAGTYAALGSRASWGPTLAIDLLPGSVAKRWGLRGEYRGYRGYNQGSLLVGALFEAGAARPKLALKLVIEAGLTHDERPILGGGVEWSLWAVGPVGVSLLTDLQVIIDGSSTRPALTSGIAIHFGR